MVLRFLMGGLSTIILSVISVMIMSYAAWMGTIWECKAHPKENVTVSIKGGDVLTGTLLCNWDGSRDLDIPGKGKVTFSEFNYMSWNMPEINADEHSVFTIPKFWRALLPPFLVLVILIFGGAFLLQCMKRMETKKNINPNEAKD